MLGPFESQAYGISNFDGTITDSKTGTVYSNSQDYDNSLIRDSGQDSITRLAKDLNVKLSDETKDYLTQYYFQAKQDRDAWARTLSADNTRYQRTVQDLKAAGLNPFLAIQSLSPGSNNSSAGSITSGSITNQLTNKRTTATTTATSLMTILGIIAAAIIHAL